MNKSEFRSEGLDLRRLGLFFQKRIWIVLLMVLIGGGLGALTYQVVRSVKMPIEYQAVSKMYVRFNLDEKGQVYQYYNGYTWNELLDSDPIMECIMGYLPGYDSDYVMESTKAEILSDIRLLTVTVTADNEKTAREIQKAVESGLAGYATLENDLRSITTIKSTPPTRIFWVDRTTTSMVVGAVLFGLISFMYFFFRYILDEAVYVQSDLEKRYSYKALGIMPRNQKGLQPYLQELKAGILFEMKDQRTLTFIDIDDHCDLRAHDMERIMNWEEGGMLDGLEDVSGGLVWHISEENEDALLFDTEEEKEWLIVPMNSDEIDAQKCEAIRKTKGVFIMVPFGVASAARKLERVITLIKNQELNILGIIITEADEEYLGRYFS